MQKARSSLLVVGNDREGQLAVDLESLDKSLLGVILAPHQGGAAVRAGASLDMSVKGGAECCATGEAGESFQDPPANFLIGQFQQHHQFQRCLEVFQCTVKMLRLADGPGEPIEEESGAMFLHPGGYDPYGQLIRDKEALAGPFVSLATECRPASALGAKESSRGDMWNTECPRETIGLGALP